MCEGGENNVGEKAIALPKRYTKSCDICFLIDAEAPKDMKWYIYKEGVDEAADGHICGNCYDGLLELKKKCHQKIDNPKHAILDNYMPWFAPEIPGLVEAFGKFYAEQNT